MNRLKFGQIRSSPMQRPCQKNKSETKLNEGFMGRKCGKERMVTDAFGKIALVPTSIGKDLHFVQNYPIASR
jgi:hypothetical protein